MSGPDEARMTDQDGNFKHLLEMARDGDEEAYQQLIAVYEPQIRLIARARLGAPMRHLLESTDIVQSVHRTLFRGLGEDRFEFASERQLLSLATTLVRRKIAQHWRKIKSQLDGNGQNQEALLATSAQNAADPQEQVALDEQWVRIFSELSPLEKELVELKLNGWTTADVARRLKIDPDVMRVKLSRLRRRLQELQILDDWL